jgi:predicted Ser/Thr protein kinase
MESYTIIEKFGEGAMAIAYKLTDGHGNSIIKKSYKDMDKTHPKFPRWHNSFKNEVSILETLSSEEHFPKLLYYDIEKYEIYMTLCGEKLSKDNVPKNWKEQLLEIVGILKKQNISHNSTSMNNACVKDGIIYFIDFASSGQFGSRKRNLTEKIINEAVSIENAFDSKKTRSVKRKID